MFRRKSRNEENSSSLLAKRQICKIFGLIGIFLCAGLYLDTVQFEKSQYLETVDLKATLITSKIEDYKVNELVLKYREKYSKSNLKSQLKNSEKVKICKEWPAGVYLFPESPKAIGFEIEVSNRIHFMLLFSHANISANYCSIESYINIIAHQNTSHFEIYLWYSKEYKEEESLKIIKSLISEYSHISLIIKEFILDDIIDGTPLQYFFRCLDYTKASLGKLGNQNRGNAARLSILYKYGGIYSDLDFVFMKDFISFQSGFSEELPEVYNTAFQIFNTISSKVFLEKAMELFVKRYEDKWGYNGPRLFMYLVETYCKRQNNLLKCLINNTEFELEVFPTNSVYPLYWKQQNEFISPYKQVITNNPQIVDSHMIHTFHHATQEYEEKLCKKKKSEYLSSYIGTLRKTYCPTIMTLVTQNCLI